MNRMAYGILGTALIIGPLAAYAQTTALEYQGNAVSGVSTYLPNGFTGGEFTPLPTSPFVGSFSGSITVDGSVSANNLSIAAADFVFRGSNFVSGIGETFSLDMIQSPQAITGASGAPDFCVSEGCVDLTISRGAITGAAVDFKSLVHDGSDYLYGIGPHGDGINYLYGNGGPCQTLTGRTIDPCSLVGSNTRAGTWIVSTRSAPEIDPYFALSGMMLLVGGVAVLRGRPS